MITLSQWISDEERQSVFSKLVSEPSFQEALFLVKQRGFPVPRQADDPSHITTLYALDHSYLMGWHAALNALTGMGKLEKKPRGKQEKSWSHINSPKPTITTDNE